MSLMQEITPQGSADHNLLKRIKPIYKSFPFNLQSKGNRQATPGPKGTFGKGLPQMERKTGGPNIFLTSLLGWVNMQTLITNHLFLLIGELRGFVLNGN